MPHLGLHCLPKLMFKGLTRLPISDYILSVPVCTPTADPRQDNQTPGLDTSVLCMLFSLLQAPNLRAKTLIVLLLFFAFKLSNVVFIMLINIKMPTFVGILTFMSMILC